jgi:hypothetical protein
VADGGEREPVAIETRGPCDILSAELGARLPPRDTVAIEMSEHRGAVDVEAGDKLAYGAPFIVRGNEPIHVSASEPALDLSIASSDPPGCSGVDVFSALTTATSLVITGLNEVDRGV